MSSIAPIIIVTCFTCNHEAEEPIDTSDLSCALCGSNDTCVEPDNSDEEQDQLAPGD